MAQLSSSVVLLHGLGRTKWSMFLFELVLKRHGFNTLNLGYRSRKYAIEQLSGQLAHQLSVHSLPTPIHFVTHSLGGIVLRHFLSHHELMGLGRTVMLSPPNQGSELAQVLISNRFCRRLLGPAGAQLGTSADSLPNQLGSVSFELGIITGNKSLNPLFSAVFPGQNDGKVSVDRAQIGGMTDFMVVPGNHTVVMNRRDVMSQVIHFLEQGMFYRNIASNESL